MTKKNTKEKDVIDQILDQLDLHDMTQEELFGAAGLAKKLTSRLLNKALEAEMDTHITYGYPVPPSSRMRCTQGRPKSSRMRSGTSGRL